MPVEFSPALREAYQVLHTRAARADLSPRTGIELRGGDRASFLNGFCTNDIKRLVPGCGCEAFVTTAKGRVAGHVFVFCGTDALVLDTAAGQAERLLGHLDRYLIREDVQLHHVTEQRRLWLIAGPQAPRILEAALDVPPPPALYGFTEFVAADHAGWIARVPLLRIPAFLVACPQAAQPHLQQAWEHAGVPELDRAVVEAARVEAGFPDYGRDITDENLPQEVGRDAQAISFQKGCYLGQETVARLDALGHVNRRLMGLKWQAGAAPDQPQPLVVGEQHVGHVTTTVWSPRFQTPLSLAYIRRGLDRPGTRLETRLGLAKVIRFAAGPTPSSR